MQMRKRHFRLRLLSKASYLRQGCTEDTHTACTSMVFYVYRGTAGHAPSGRLGIREALNTQYLCNKMGGAVLD